MSLPFFLDWPHLIFRDFLLTMCMNIILFIAKEIDTCAALHVPGKGFSLLLANLILLLRRMKSLVGDHSSWKLEKGWSCNGKLASERLQESQACPLCFLRGPEIPNTASRKTSPSLEKGWSWLSKTGRGDMVSFPGQSLLLLHFSKPWTHTHICR